MKADLPDLRVRSGGYSSVDVSKHGIDKAYAVRRLAEILDVPVGNIVFVGDRMTPDGNDYPAVAVGAVGMKVENPQDALGLMDALLQRVGASA